MSLFQPHDEAVCPGRGNVGGFSGLQWLVVLGMLLTLAISSLDALDGQQVGRDNALTIAKLKAQQALVARRTESLP